MPKWAGLWLDQYVNARTGLAFGTIALVGQPLAERRRYRWFLCLGAGLLGVLFEFVQYFIPTRVCDWKDMAWSMAGALIAGLLWELGLALKSKLAR